MQRMRIGFRGLRPCASCAGLGLLFALVSLPGGAVAAAAPTVPADGTALTLTAPSGRIVGPGTGLELVWKITNHTAAAATVTLDLTTSRSWPLLRTIRGLTVAANDSVSFLQPSAVPDTAAAGEVAIFARMHLDGDATTLDSCTNMLLVRSAPSAAVPIEVVPDLVRLEWHSWLNWGDRGIVELSRDGESWHPAGAITAGLGGRCVFEDRNVKPGGTVDYRLRATVNGLTMVTAVTTVHVPERTPLTFAGLWPNPSRTTPVIAFTLPERATTRIEVYDLAGRRVWASDLGELAPGPHVQTLEPHGALRSGMYVFRLSSGGHSVSVRGVIAR